MDAEWGDEGCRCCELVSVWRLTPAQVIRILDEHERGGVRQRLLAALLRLIAG